MMRRYLLATLATAALAIATAAVPAGQPSRRRAPASSRAHVPDTTIRSAEEVAGPSFTPGAAAALTGLPAFCRVAGVTKPAVNFEVWLPLDDWNGKFQGVGNGAQRRRRSATRAMAHGARARLRGREHRHRARQHRNARDAAWALGHPGTGRRLRLPRAFTSRPRTARRSSRAFYGEPAEALVLRRLLQPAAGRR